MYTDHTKTTKFFNELLSVDDILNTPKKTEIQISTIKLQDFDPEIQSWVIEKQLEPLIKYFSFPPSEINAWKNYIKKLAICHNNAKIVMPDGRIFKRTQGLISGAKEYKYLQYRINYFLIQYCLAIQQLEVGLSERPPLIHAIIVRDTSSLILSERLDLEKFNQNLSKTFNVELDRTVTPHGCVSRTITNWGTELDGLSFVGYSCFGGIFETDVLTTMKRLLYPNEKEIPEETLKNSLVILDPRFPQRKSDKLYVTVAVKRQMSGFKMTDADYIPVMTEKGFKMSQMFSSYKVADVKFSKKRINDLILMYEKVQKVHIRPNRDMESIAKLREGVLRGFFRFAILQLFYVITPKSTQKYSQIHPNQSHQSNPQQLQPHPQQHPRDRSRPE